MARASKKCIVGPCLGAFFRRRCDFPLSSLELYALHNPGAQLDVRHQVEECCILMQILHKLLVTSVDGVTSRIHRKIAETACVTTRVEDGALIDGGVHFSCYGIGICILPLSADVALGFEYYCFETSRETFFQGRQTRYPFLSLDFDNLRQDTAFTNQHRQ